MKRLITFGKGFEFVGDNTPSTAPTIGDAPKIPQKVRTIRREYMSVVPALKTKHNGYRPGRLLDLCTDQCRFSLESGLFCGVKVVNGAWCGDHDAIVYGRFREADE